MTSPPFGRLFPSLAVLGALLLQCLTPVHAGDAAPAPLPAVAPKAAGFSPQRLDALHRRIEDEVAAGRYSGCIVLIARDGRIVDWRAHGWQDIDRRKPLEKDSIVRIFSMSKIVTSVAVLTLLEDGRLKLDDPVEKYLPGLKDRQVVVGGTADAPRLEPARRSITIRDLLTHSSGYYYDESWSADALPMALMQRAKLWEAADLDDFIARLAAVPLSEQPGTRFRYGISTDILGAVVEKASGQRLDAFLRERIFAPLGMVDTGFWVPAGKLARLATVYERDNQDRLVPSGWANAIEAGPDHGILSGGGGLYSTAADYVRFAQMLLNGGQLDGVRILGRKTVALMASNHLKHLADPHPSGAPGQGFGLGVRVLTDPGEGFTLGSPGAFGWEGAATTFVQIDPQERTVALLLLQHLPYNQDDVIASFTNGYYSALDDMPR
ncbi:serine hydrolase domain-containing protein [Pseudoxanthomonas wuyuanensis]|uniref:CubicO group peptidase, beta-lactamase class C family n=1 Tax=Pseudoxanthomonas wuyuanensis TaxID=1073196 RepID=A0A286DAX0_9GAMM|nr:serine hydrolase domain-containing protein [Pseudoxanthomonas wuyuanensis]KAF1721821.1 serine hydrolase [Pseudoxanthomonas wuyuanensis]SOD55795.1 CubicO group peptidase, beta-lactamase class C family [Pseudoxanthomonas wuyuanensis]